MDKIDIRGIDDEERGFGVAKEELIVRLIYRRVVFPVHVFFKGPSAHPDAMQEGIRVRLEKDHQVGFHGLGIEQLIDLLVERQFLLVQVQIREDPVFREEIIAWKERIKSAQILTSAS